MAASVLEKRIGTITEGRVVEVNAGCILEEKELCRPTVHCQVQEDH